MSISHNRSAQLTTPVRWRPWKMRFRQGPAELCPARPAPESFCRVREREALTRPRHSSSPLDYSLLPNQNSIAQFEEQSHDGGEKSRHDDEGGEDFAVFGPTLGPTNIPTKSGFNSHGFRDHESQKR